MTSADALETIRGLAKAGRIVFTSHARKRMGERGARPADVRCALGNGRLCMPGDEPEKWKVTGPDLDGDDLDVVAVIEGDVVVITVF